MFETPLTLHPHDTVLDALHLIPKRAHGAVVVVDAERRPVGIVTAEDCARVDRYTQLEDVMSTEVLTLDAGDLEGPTALPCSSSAAAPSVAYPWPHAERSSR